MNLEGNTHPNTHTIFSNYIQARLEEHNPNYINLPLSTEQCSNK
jgi:hypothetical protein